MSDLRQHPEWRATKVAATIAVSRCLVTVYRFAIGPLAEAIGPELSGTSVDTPAPVFNGVAVGALALVVALALRMVAIGQQGGRQGAAWGPEIYWSGLFVLTLPVVYRLVSPSVQRLERLVLLLILAEASYAVSLLSSPMRVSHFDEFLHWLTAINIMQSHRLFQDNSLLPISPLYPGLEILTTALADLTQLPLFGAAIAVLLVLRALLISALFLIYEKIGGSVRLAAVGCVAYMGNSGYVLFDSQFAYESLAIVLLALVLLASAEERAATTTAVKSNVLVLLITAALAVTHHVTGAVAVLLLGTTVSLNILSRSARQERRSMMLVAGTAVALMVAWSFVIGNPVVDYLGPVFQAGIDGFFHSASKPQEARQAFVAADGTRMPLVLQLVGMGSVLIVAVGLATGFCRSLAIGTAQRDRRGWFTLVDTIRCRWVNHRAILLTLMTLCWPLSIILRLTPGGWEIGNRMGHISISVLVSSWRSRSPSSGKRLADGAPRSSPLPLCLLPMSAVSSLGGACWPPARPTRSRPMPHRSSQWA